MRGQLTENDASVTDGTYSLVNNTWNVGDLINGTDFTQTVTYDSADQPALPPMVELWSHNLDCVAHSAIIAAAVTLFVLALRSSLWIPFLGWWSHIVIDVFKHSADYYPTPVLYSITERGFDGLA